MAAKPYEIEKERLKVYSTEELCFYLKHHIYDVDNTIINGKLATWLRDEIGESTGDQDAGNHFAGAGLSE